MPKLAEDVRRELLILDTGPIWEFLLFRAVVEYSFQSLRPRLQYIRDKNSYDECSKFIATFQTRSTSASVVAELYQHIRQTEPGGHRRLWNLAYEEFRSMGMKEEAIHLLQMDLELVTRFGPVDVSLLELARSRQKDQPIILTVDSALCGECRKAGLRVIYIEEVTMAIS